MNMEAHFTSERFSLHIVTLLLITVTLGLSQQANAASCQPPPKIDLTVIEESSNSSQGQEFSARIETTIKNGQVRRCIDNNLFALVDPHGYSIADSIGSRNDSTGKQRSCNIITANGDHIYLIPQSGSKTYMKRSASDIKRQRENTVPPELLSATQNIATSQTPSNLTKTDRTRVIDGLKAALHVGNSADGKTQFEFWVTTDIEDIDLVKQAKECADRQLDSNSFMDTIYDTIYELPGIVLESVSIVNGKEISRSHLDSISRDPIPDTDFQIPAGYQTMAERMGQKTQGGSGQAVPWFPGMPDIPDVPVQR